MKLLYKFNLCMKEYFDKMGRFDINGFMDDMLSDDDLLFLHNYYSKLMFYPVYYMHRKKSIDMECKVEEL